MTPYITIPEKIFLNFPFIIYLLKSDNLLVLIISYKMTNDYIVKNTRRPLTVCFVSKTEQPPPKSTCLTPATFYRFQPTGPNNSLFPRLDLESSLRMLMFRGVDWLVSSGTDNSRTQDCWTQSLCLLFHSHLT